MNYDYIINPLTNRKCSINSKLGKKVLTNYIQTGGNNCGCNLSPTNPIMSGGASPCPITNFIYFLYDSGILFPNDERKKEQCFLRGTFVFEDNNSEIFKMLEKAGCNKTQSFWKTTHSEARLKNAVDASLRLKGRPKGISVSEKWKYDKDKNGKLEKFYQYEHKLNPAIVYLCDNICRTANKNGHKICSEKSRVDAKEVLFMYHFKTKSNLGDKVRKFTLIKLEGHFSISLGHTIAAVKRYGLGKEGKTAYKTTRREDCSKKNSCQFKGTVKCIENKCGIYDSSHDYHVRNFMTSQNKQSLLNSVKFYSENLRTGDELFIPQNLTDHILKKFKY